MLLSVLKSSEKYFELSNLSLNFIRVETIDGSAKEQEDYEPLNEILTFEPNEGEKEIGVKIVDDNQWEPDEEFFVKLTLIPGKESEDVRLGRTSIMEITILNDDGNDQLTIMRFLWSYFASGRAMSITYLIEVVRAGNFRVQPSFFPVRTTSNI